MFSFQLEEIAKSPLIEIGAHTMDHMALAGMATDSAKFQISQSRIALQKELHLPINSFAYPYGSFDQQAINLVREAGFIDAASTFPILKIRSIRNTIYIDYALGLERDKHSLPFYLKINSNLGNFSNA